MHPIKVTEKKNDKNNKYKYINYEIKKNNGNSKFNGRKSRFESS